MRSSQQQQIIELIQEGQFPAAVLQLEAMADKSGEEGEWARQELTRVKALPDKLRRDVPSLVRTAQSLVDHHDYRGAAELLMQIPAPYRTPDAKRLLNESTELQEEVDMLVLSIEEALRSRQVIAIDDNVRRLVKLKPGNTEYRKLLENLEAYRKYPEGRRNYRFNDDDELLPPSDGSVAIAVATTVAVGAIAGLLTWWALQSYFAAEHESLHITVAESVLEAGDLQVTFAGETYDVGQREKSDQC